MELDYEMTMKELEFIRKELRVIKKMIGDKYASDTEAEEESEEEKKETDSSPNEKEA